MATSKKAAPVKVNLQKVVFEKLNVQKAEAKKALKDKQKTDRETFRAKQKLETVALTERFSSQVKKIADDFLAFMSKPETVALENSEAETEVFEIQREVVVPGSEADKAGLRRHGHRK